MRLVVIVASIGRREVLERMLRHLERQDRAPDEVVLSIVDPNDAPGLDALRLNVRALFGPKGLAAQRNTALRSVLPHADIVTFLDDDFLLAEEYLARVEAAFEKHLDVAVVHGNVVADGVCGAGLTFEEGLAALEAARPRRRDENPRIVNHSSAYGCNMSFRASLIGDLSFDERLVLYGWQEDRDFSFRVGRRGRVVEISNIVGVHLGVKGGRVNGVRLGYSQIVNPIYLVGKGTMPVHSAANLMLRNLTANTVKSWRPEPWVDRRGRLRGNMLGLAHVMSGRVEPEHVLKL